MIGTTLNHYRVLRQLGTGGMGEVYEAEDTHLHRKVAIKVLPRTVASDPERRQRFKREAQAIAALNHPNIVTIHSVEDADGVPFLTMELVEGTTLADLLQKGGLPIDRLLKMGVAIAEAISAAQQRGITHRDLKPTNIMVTAAGAVKVLDFGLAKLREMEGSAAGEAATMLGSPTGLTGEGRIVGTVAYMSPEQAEGKPVDSRSDIFSLGVILHEMATGEQPFRGDTPVSVISSIIKDTPSSVTDLEPGLPTDLGRIVKRCLAKDPERRYQTATDLRNELEELKAGIDSGEILASGVRPAPARSSGLRSGRVRIAIAGLILVALAVVGIIAALRRAPRASSPVVAPVSLEAMKISRLTSTGKATGAAISPDGKYVVHVVNDAQGPSLWIRQVATASNVQIVPPADVRYDGIVFSPDGTYVYYNTYEAASGFAALYQIPVLGGTPRKILNDIDGPVSFSPDGHHMVFVRGVTNPAEARLIVANVNGTEERVLASTRPPELFNLTAVAWSPDGKHVAASQNLLRVGVEQRPVVVDVEGGAVHELGTKRWLRVDDLAWVADGSAIVASATEQGVTNRQLWRIAYPAGEATRITNDLINYTGVSLSADSRALATVQSDILSDVWMMPAGDIARAKAITSGSGRYDGLSGMAWTPDGRLAYDSVVGGNLDIWIMDADGGNQKQLTVDPAFDMRPVVTPDGRYIVFMSSRSGNVQLWRMDLDGGNPVQLTKGDLSVQPLSGGDGRFVVYDAVTLDGKQAVWQVPIDGGAPQKLSDHALQTQTISPDGRFVAGLAWDAERRRQSIGVLTLTGTEPAKLFPILPRAVAWAPAGQAFTYVDVKDGVANIWSQAIAGGAPRQLTTFTSDFIYNFAWSRDGKRLALTRGKTSTDVVLLSAR
jgi:Tol biopolymer transport system component